jgi:hypothetical protein
MSCPFAGLATRYTANGERVTVRICVAVPYERNEDPDDLPLPSVCFSDSAYKQCYHYRTMIKRKEIAQRLGVGAPLMISPPVPDPTAEVTEFRFDGSS